MSSAVASAAARAIVQLCINTTAGDMRMLGPAVHARAGVGRSDTDTQTQNCESVLLQRKKKNDNNDETKRTTIGGRAPHARSAQLTLRARNHFCAQRRQQARTHAHTPLTSRNMEHRPYLNQKHFRETRVQPSLSRFFKTPESVGRKPGQKQRMRTRERMATTQT